MNATGASQRLRSVPLYSVIRMKLGAGRGSETTTCDQGAVGARLRLLRREAGMTQTQLAQALGTTQSAIARMEGGGQKLHLESIGRVAAVLGCSVAVVFEQKESV